VGKGTIRTPLEEFDEALARRLREGAILDGDDLDEALAEQIICGGSLSATLWELGLLSIKELNDLGARILSIHAVTYNELVDVRQEVVELFSREFIAKARVLPVRKESMQLWVATCEPWRLDVLDETSFRSGCIVHFAYLNEVSLSLCLEKFYGIPSNPRFKIQPVPRKRKAKTVTTTSAKDPCESVDELMSQEDFAKLYQDIEIAKDEFASRPFAQTAPASESQGIGVDAAQPLLKLMQQVLEKAAQPNPLPLTNVTNALESGAAAQPSSPVATEPDAPPQESPAPRPLPKPTLAEPTGDEAATSVEQCVEPVALVAKPVPELKPIQSLQNALLSIDRAADRERLGETVVRFALSKSNRVVLFTCKNKLWMGWTGGGKDVSVGYAASLIIPSEPGTFFGLVANTGAHYMGPVIDHPVHRQFFKTLGPPTPKTVGFFPVHYKGRIVFGIYLDGGDDLSLGIAEILVMAQRVPIALERLVRKRNTSS